MKQRLKLLSIFS